MLDNIVNLKNSSHCNTPFFEIQMHPFEEGDLYFRRVFIDPVFFLSGVRLYAVNCSHQFSLFSNFLNRICSCWEPQPLRTSSKRYA